MTHRFPHRLFRQYARLLQHQIAIERYNRSPFGSMLNQLKQVYAPMLIVNPDHFIALHTLLAHSKGTTARRLP